jgi:hypothetical protein
MRKTIAATLLLLALVSASPSCATRAPLPVTAEDNVTRLLQHPQFPMAAQVAPDFTREALKTIARLEKEKANAGH